MKLINLIKSEFSDFGQKERIIFPLLICFIIILSIITKDNKIALISAICGISYTILAGKGKVSCYFLGITGTICYSYLAFKNGFYGNLLLYSLYYLPMEIIGIFKWSKHLKKESREIIKTKLSKKERIIYFSITIAASILLWIGLNIFGGETAILDSTATVFSVLGQLLTVKRCIEQWYIWFIVNMISLIMWIIAYINGSNCLATIVMWFVYVILAIYFLRNWEKEFQINAAKRHLV